MIDQERASRLAEQGFALWQSGRAADAVPLYEEALQFADPRHYGLPDYHGEFAGVLSQLSRFEEAGRRLEKSLGVSLDQGANEGSNEVVVARHFLAEHFLARKEPQLALDALQPSLESGIELEWLLRYSSACALHALNRIEEACTEASTALATVKSEEKRQEPAEMFSESVASTG